MASTSTLALALLLAPAGAYLLASPRAPHRALLPTAGLRHAAVAACDGSDDLNWLQTKLNKAVDDEDYDAAASLRDRMERAVGVAGVCDWVALGVPAWMDGWLQRLGFAMPTRVQLHALRALPGGDDAAICADTGSGKTLAYLVPIIAALSEDLIQEDLSNFLSAALRGGQSVQWAREQVKADQSEAEMQTPALLIVVPTRELGVQTSLLAYRLLGGGESNPTIQPYAHPSRYRPGAKANMFNYDGLRHVRVAGLWDEQVRPSPDPACPSPDPACHPAWFSPDRHPLCSPSVPCHPPLCRRRSPTPTRTYSRACTSSWARRTTWCAP